jgi:hypothetical protein
MIFSQLPAATSTEIGAWLVSAAAVLYIVKLGKDTFVRKPPIEAEFTSQTEFRKHKEACGPKIDRIEKEFLPRHEFVEFKREIRAELIGINGQIRCTTEVIGEKLDVMKTDLMAAGERRASAMHERINDVAEMVNRVDERTKTP